MQPSRRLVARSRNVGIERNAGVHAVHERVEPIPKIVFVLKGIDFLPVLKGGDSLNHAVSWFRAVPIDGIESSGRKPCSPTLTTWAMCFLLCALGPVRPFLNTFRAPTTSAFASKPQLSLTHLKIACVGRLRLSLL